MNDRMKNFILPASSFGASFAVVAGGIGYELTHDTTRDDGTTRDEALAMQGLTDDQYDDLRGSVDPLSDAQFNLEYTPPNTKCNSKAGFSTGCEPEKFPSVPDAIKSLDVAEERLMKAGRDVELAVVEGIEGSLIDDAQNNVGKYTNEPISNETYSSQRLALETVRKKLSDEALQIQTQAFKDEEADSTTLGGDIAIAAVGFGSIPAFLTGIWWIVASVDAKKKKSGK